jgi:hypothetical protein
MGIMIFNYFLYFSDLMNKTEEFVDPVPIINFRIVRGIGRGSRKAFSIIKLTIIIRLLWLGL